MTNWAPRRFQFRSGGTVPRFRHRKLEGRPNVLRFRVRFRYGVGLLLAHIWFLDHWPSAGKEEIRAYNAALCGELAAMGFDEIVLEEFYFPIQGKLDTIRKSST